MKTKEGRKKNLKALTVWLQVEDGDDEAKDEEGGMKVGDDAVTFNDKKTSGLDQ